MAQDPAAAISQGSLRDIFTHEDPSQWSFPTPVLQCVQVKPMAQQSGAPDRYRVVLSDIQNFVQCMLAVQANNLVHEGKLKRGVFVRLKNFQSNTLKDKRILIILDLDVLTELGVAEKIGEPATLITKVEESGKPHSTVISSEGFYGNKAKEETKIKSQPQSLPTRASNPPHLSSGGHANIFPIEAISPYANKWTIKARCTQKSNIKTWHKQTGDGKLFNVNLLDDSGEIRATGFNEQCDALYELFQEGSVYYISSPCKVNMANKRYSNINNDYELMFDRDTLVEKAEDQESAPRVRFNFTSIADLQTVDKDTTIDVIGVCKEIHDLSQITSTSTKKPYDKRELVLVDQSGYSVRLTVWGSTAVSFDAPVDSVLAFKGVKVSDFGGRSLSLLSSGSMTVEPEIDESYKLKGWYEAQGRSDTFASHASMAGAIGSAGGRVDAFKTIGQVRDENLGMSENPDYFAIKATIIYIKQDNISYPACLSADCNKKVIEVEQGQWRCERCNINHPKPEHRYILAANVTDHTGGIWISCFDEVGKLLMGMSADELVLHKDNGDKAADEAFQEANCKTWIFKCRAKMDNYQDQQRVRYQVTSASPLNFSVEAAKLAETLKLYNMD
ncbi:MAG: Replication factor A protein 1 [Trizodia sp. TS-e1964]|nr:MAG: Replication factor A protein 1 [Trizodia sp. TS-e1964]